MAQESFILEIARYLKRKYKLQRIISSLFVDQCNFWWDIYEEFPKENFPHHYGMFIEIDKLWHQDPPPKQPKYSKEDLEFFNQAANKANFKLESYVEHCGRLIFDEINSPIEIVAEGFISHWRCIEDEVNVDDLPFVERELSAPDYIEAVKLSLRVFSAKWHYLEDDERDNVRMVANRAVALCDQNLLAADKLLPKLIKKLRLTTDVSVAA
jgi:hypothetical protein